MTAYAAVNAHYAAAIRLIDETCRHPAKINSDQAIQIAQVEAILALVQAIKENASTASAVRTMVGEPVGSVASPIPPPTPTASARD